MTTELLPLIVTAISFGAVTAVAFVIGQYVVAEVQLQRRAGLAQSEPESADFFAGVSSLVSTYFDEKRLGLEDSFKAKLRRDLIRAGFFHVHSFNYYIFARVAVAVALPAAAAVFAFTSMAQYGWPLKLILLALAFVMGNLGPSALLARRQRVLTERYRQLFPDLLDLMVVCVDAGLSLEAALERISREMMRQSRHLGMNLVLLGAEMRAGRSTADALGSLADRLGLDEARAFVAMLRQSIELGTDVATALRVFSDEMRDRRLLRAEERANQLPVKMVFPLGLFIFPVILLVVLFPVIVKLVIVFRAV